MKSKRALQGVLRTAVLGALFQALACSAVWAQTQSPKTVLAVLWGTEDYPSNPVEDAAIREGLLSGSDAPIEYYAEYLEATEFPNDEAWLALRDYIQRKYKGRRIDAVVAVSDVALQFVLRFRQELFADAPIVYRGITAVDAATRNTGAGLTGILHGGGLHETLDLALKLHPSTERVFVVAQSANIELQNSMRAEVRRVAPRIAITFITEGSVPRLVAAVKAVPPGSVIHYVRYSQDDPGSVLSPLQVAHLVAEASPVPVYGSSEWYIGSGVVGGIVYVTQALGTRLGEMARQILAGRRAQDIPLEQPTLVPVFDWRQLQRWGIVESRLPAGSMIQYRQPTAWELYKPQIIGGGLVVLLQSALIAALLLQRERRRRIKKALHDSQQRYALATAAGAVGVWDWNLATNDVYVDPTLKAMLGFDDAEIPNIQAWESLVHPDDAGVPMTQAKACIDGAIDGYEVAHRMVHKDGRLRWFLTRGSLVRHADGTPHRLVGTSMDITERKQIEEAIRKNEAVLLASHRQIQDLAGRLIAAQEAERSRIARDLHDDTSQQLAGLAVALSGLKYRVSALQGAKELQVEVGSLQQRTMALAEHIRHLSHDLHPSVLEHVGLVDSLAAYCEEVQRQQAIKVTFNSEGDFESTSKEVALCLYRIAQEALRNVVAHAGAQRADVGLVRSGDSVELTIADDGKGFDIARMREARTGLGLISMNERVRLAGGTTTITTELNKGTRVRVQIPANHHAQADAGDESDLYATPA